MALVEVKYEGARVVGDGAGAAPDPPPPAGELTLGACVRVFCAVICSKHQTSVHGACAVSDASFKCMGMDGAYIPHCT